MTTLRVMFAFTLGGVLGLLAPLASVHGQPEDAAKEFANGILSATGVIAENHLKPASRADMVRWAVTGLYHATKLPVPKALAKRLEKLDKANGKELYKVLYDARVYCGDCKELKNPADLDIALQAIFDTMEPGFKHPKQEEWTCHLSGSVVGIGVILQEDAKSGLLKVKTPIFKSPAYKAGIRQGDLITQITVLTDWQGNPLAKPQVTSTKGLTVEAATKLILGPEGSKIRLKIMRDGKEKKLTIKRGRVETETVLGAQREPDDTWNHWADAKGKIGYVRLTQFSTNTFARLEATVRQLSKAGVKGLVLDLRFNPGGLLDSAARTACLFAGDGILTTIWKKDGLAATYAGKVEGSYPAFPMACLINGDSRSGSEIVAACLQDHGRAIIVGERSAGKAEIRTMWEFDGGVVQVMTAVFYRPNGRNLSKFLAGGIDAWGVEPTPGFAVPLSDMERLHLAQYFEDNLILRHPEDQHKAMTFHDRQLEMAVNYLRKLPKLKAAK